jgi:hypothetical protein
MRSLLASAVGLWALLTVAGGAARQDLPGATDTHGGFGLPDQRGARLLVIPNLARPERITTALCGGGRRVVVRFERRQEARENNGRQSGRNFDSLAGSVYSIAGNTVDPEAPCLLASDALLAGSAILNVASPDGSRACDQRDRFATLRDRPVVQCWPLARLGPDTHVALIEFERRGKDALASVVVMDGARTMFADIRAQFRGAGQDLWRVDDGGVLSPEGLKVVSALRRGRWFALGIAWAAAEGRALSLWVSDDSDRFTQVINDYWYQAPI